MYILKDGACGVARPRFRGVRDLRQAQIYRNGRLGHPGQQGYAGKNTQEQERNYRRNERDENNACIEQ